jgi:hypothetical protein
MSNHSQPATGKQLAYLRVLATETGTTFATPHDRRQASREIERLRQLRCRNGKYVETPAGSNLEESYATAPQPGEIDGWGASARWRTSGHETKRPAGSSRGAGPGAEGDGARERPLRLASYADARGENREIITVALSHGSLVIDRLAGSGHDPRLVGRLDADEPAQNAKLLARMYLGDERRGRCRPVTEADLTAGPDGGEQNGSAEVQWRAPLVAGIGVLLQIRCLSDDRGKALRWTVTTRTGADRQVLPLRQVFGLLQAYEPAASMTRAALAAHPQSPGVSVCGLRAELDRACNSPIVLNRALRERVERAVATEGLSMSEIATRCGRVKRSRNGSESGETSWLARRIGQLPEAGRNRPTPWVHSDVLALIARDGLGTSPHEVEL